MNFEIVTAKVVLIEILPPRQRTNPMPHVYSTNCCQTFFMQIATQWRKNPQEVKYIKIGLKCF